MRASPSHHAARVPACSGRPCSPLPVLALLALCRHSCRSLRRAAFSLSRQAFLPPLSLRALPPPRSLAVSFFLSSFPPPHSLVCWSGLGRSRFMPAFPRSLRCRRAFHSRSASSKELQGSRSVGSASAAAGATSSGSRPFSLSFFLLAVLHFVVYSLLVCEAPAQAFLVREQANFEGFSVLCVHSQTQSLIHQALAGASVLYTALAIQQRTLEAKAEEAARASASESTTQPPSLASAAASGSGSHFLGLFAFQPTGNDNGKAAPAAATIFAAILAAASA
jgi:hypothetical protein